MAEHEPIPARDNPEVAHEAADVNIKAIVGFGAGLAVITLGIGLVLYWLLAYYGAREAGRWQPTTLVERAQEPAPGPGLEVAPQAALAELRAAEEKVLHSYEWIDREKSVVGIPIERAMKIIAAKGLPFRNQPPQKENAAPVPARQKGRGAQR